MKDLLDLFLHPVVQFFKSKFLQRHERNLCNLSQKKKKVLVVILKAALY